LNQSPPIALRELQARLSAILRGLEHPPLGSAAALAEEAGEVSKLLLDHHAYGKPLDPAALGAELADVLVCLCEIATLHGVDLAGAAESRLTDLAARAPRWKQELGAALERAWRVPSGPGARRPG
jgi:NTP pyrophosphatase (non-canonical NTP hydrolase)